ncbi:MAG: Lrp/AsnC family transcriptional regulator [Sporolactobacillus sp.]|uniref:Lrp/AsnC family transcriptional regulator n=1 Tax=Sporolactobacillus sp. STSJ-5 TaxID=2965076 RepID=UPI002107C5DF|nr:Lrp/AsnC family transcriptional regulator [Sporolactobacillus sp. STSJ-5]MCQ2010443.1 Lrp/AsnC family transcriptional regulator [Sporolactobacillus sp. STSJ-5]
MDAIDRKILNRLQQNARVSIKALADECYISSPTISARIHQMEKQGIIKNYYTLIDYKKMGYHIKAYVNLKVEPSDKHEFYKYIEKIPNVLECDCVSGEFAMLIKVIFESTELLDSFINELQRFGKTNTQIVFSTPVIVRGIELDSFERREFPHKQN